MATSSIVEKIRVNNPKVIEEYVAAMEVSENAPVTKRQNPTANYVTDSEELREMMQRGIQKWGKK